MIPITEIAKMIVKKYGLRQVIVLTYDGRVTSMAAHGSTTNDTADIAYDSGQIKKMLGWDATKRPSIVKTLQRKIKNLTAKLDGLDVEQDPEFLPHADVILEELTQNMKERRQLLGLLGRHGVPEQKQRELLHDVAATVDGE